MVLDDQVQSESCITACCRVKMTKEANRGERKTKLPVRLLCKTIIRFTQPSQMPYPPRHWVKDLTSTLKESYNTCMSGAALPPKTSISRRDRESIQRVIHTGCKEIVKVKFLLLELLALQVPHSPLIVPHVLIDIGGAYIFAMGVHMPAKWGVL